MYEPKPPYAGQPLRMSPPVIRFADFELDLVRYELRQAGARVELQRVPMDLLILLAEHRGALVARDEIVARLWSGDTLTDTERSINTAIRKVRQALSDDAGHPRFVETVVGRGYRFIAPVILDDARDVPPVAESPRTLERDFHPFHRSYIWGTLLVLSLAILALTSLSPRGPALPSMRVTPFAALPGLEANPSFSPDGTEVVFSLTQSSGSQHLYRKAVGIGSPDQLTDGPGLDSNPSWSRDGGTIAFLRRDPVGTMAVYVKRVSGGAERKLTDLLEPREFQPSWSGDGKSVAVIDSEPGTTKAVLFLLSVESGQKRRLIAPAPSGTGDWAPAYSPDGQWLAFLRNAGTSQSSLLYELPVGRSGEPIGPEHAVRTGRTDITAVEWSPDARSFLCETHTELVRIPRSGGSSEQLPFSDATETVVSPAGHRLVYVRSTHNVDIFAIPGPRASGGAVSVISSTRVDGAPSYSADGERIAFVSDRTGSLEVWTSDSAGRDVAQLTQAGAATVGCPRWSPDGQSVAFDSAGPAGTHIFLVSAQDRQPRQITYGASAEVRPSWSHDGRWIYFGSNRSGRWEIWKTTPDGTATLLVTHNGGREAFEDAEGHFLYFTKEPPVHGIWQVRVSGGEESLVTDQGSQGRWALGDHGVYYLKGEAQIERLALSDRSTLSISTAGLHLATGTGGLLSIGPGERSILVTAAVRTESELMMVEGFR